MNGITYLQVDAFPVLVLAVLLANSLAHLPYSQENKLFRLLIVLLMGASCVDALSWLCDGRVPVPLLYGINILLGLLSVSVSFVWFLYVCATAFDYRVMTYTRRLLAVLSLPAIAFAFISVSSPWTQALFFINAEGRYEAGELYYLLYTLGFSYVAVASVVALVRAVDETFPWKRRRLFDLALFVVPPLVGAVLQIAFDGLSMLLPSMALSVVLVYVALQHDEIALDSLTGLSNRSSFDEKLAHLCDSKAQRPWCLIMLDVNDFKQVNDRLGHVAGDEALRELARALKTVFRRKPAFLARYGGDEFAIVYEGADETEARCAVADVRSQLEDARVRREGPAAVSFSVGYVPIDQGEHCEAPRVLEAADARMYEEKLRGKGLA